MEDQSKEKTYNHLDHNSADADYIREISWKRFT